MEFEKRAMTQEEDKYSFRQSSQISMQCGLIGHLRADMDTDGNGFFSSWDDYRRDLKTTEFKEEFDEVINSLREEGDILHNRSALAKYCYSHPQSKMSTEQDYYGVRVDTAQYSYLLRLNPNKGEYNLYCYCYRRDWLSRHIEQARRGIRFIDPHYKELFRIPDGDKIRVTFPDGETKDQICRYIDDYHVEMGVGDNLYHICKFAERMESIGAKVIPLRSSLPEQCYSMLPDTGEIIILKKGEFKSDRQTANPYAARTPQSRQSVPSSRKPPMERATDAEDTRKRPSVRQELKELREELNRKNAMEVQREPLQHIAPKPKKKHYKER